MARHLDKNRKVKVKILSSTSTLGKSTMAGSIVGIQF